jgi:short-subunit dehydrogenase
MTYWTGKRAVVTGGSAGLGRALAGALVERGARVAIAARGQEHLDKTTEDLRSRGGNVLAVSGDVTNEGDVQRLSATVQSAWGGVDLLCHCAGRSMRGTVLATPIESYQEMLEVNFLSAVRCVKAFAPALISSHGHVVLIGSLASKVASAYLGAYPASKFPLAAFAQQLRLETHQQGLHTLLVCPGPIAREEAVRPGGRYAEHAPGVPEEALKPAGGAKVRAIDPVRLASQILRACEKRQPELVVPGRAKLLFALGQLSPTLGDWLLRRMTAS